MRLVLVGGTSFIAHHVQEVAAAQNVETIVVNRWPNLMGLVAANDVIINFTMDPAYQREPYDESVDLDLAVARIAAEANAKNVLLSTRRVYPADQRWNAQAAGFASGDETHYGKNKARTEKAINDLGARNVIFRLSNVFGFEYRPEGSRRTFFGEMMRSLREEDVIRFNMPPETRRDFIPVEVCAKALIRAIHDDLSGIHNLGSGFPMPCGDLAISLCEGYRSGTLVTVPPLVCDEFFLDIGDWTSRYGGLTTRDEILNYCHRLGQRLRCEKF